MYLTMRSFKKAFNDVIMSRRAIHNMNTWYPDATEEELASTDNICIICREEMLAPTTKKLPCGHIFHKTCLRSWFQRQQTCPTCRLDVLRSPLPRQRAAAAAAAANATPAAAPAAAQAANGQQQPAAAAAAAAAPPQPAPARPTPEPSAAAAANTTAATATATTATATATTTAAANGLPPFVAAPAAAGATTLPPFPPMPMPMAPPFGFAPPPYIVPLPMPPPNFSGMTDEELSAMEGTERANVEARVKD